MKRELRVAFSRHAQPVWFRITKWTLIIVISRRFAHSRWFRVGMLGAFLAAMLLHLGYRWKTHGWTRPWGGWNDPTFVTTPDI